MRPCGVCRREQQIKRVALDGDPDMCQACWKRDPRSWRVCGGCGALKPSAGRDRETGAPICERCYRHARPVDACEHCGRIGRLARTGARGGPKLCGACAERERRPKRVCGRCGRLAAIALRQAADGTRELCFACYAREPRRICGGCGEFAAIQLRGRDGKPDLCRACYQLPTARCSVCHRERPCSFARTPAPVCSTCKPRRIATCADCGRDRPVKARSPLGPLCGTCHLRRRQAPKVCDRCGEVRRPGRQTDDEVLCRECTVIVHPRTCESCGSPGLAWNRRVCPACSLRARVERLRASGLPSAVAQLDPFLETLARAPHPQAVSQWLGKPDAGRTLQELATGELELSHEALDGPGRRKGTEYLRAALVHAGALPARDELLVTLAAWTTERLSVIPAGPDHVALRRFATWKVARELAARRRDQRDPDPLAVTMPKRWIATAIELTAWLHGRELTLDNLDQPLLDEWLASGPPHRRVVRAFITWLQREHTRRGLRVPPDPPGTPATALSDHDRLTALRAVLEDETLEAHIRVASCLVALYAQPVARIVRLTTPDIQLTNDTAQVRLGHDLVPLPAPLRPAAAKMLECATTAQTRWLFPGRIAGHPVNPMYLAHRLRDLGIPVAATRSSALAALAHRIPSPVLADVLGLSAKTTAKASGRLKVDYAHYIARRLISDPRPRARGPS